MTIIECVPNISEGRRKDVIDGITSSLKAIPGLRVLDVQSDASHNRSVYTLAGDAAAMTAGIPKLFEGALAAIDLRSHKGEHPRLGAVDVVPFIPIEGVTMAECVTLAKSIAEDVASRFTLPVYLYGMPRPIRRARTSKTSAAASSRGWRRRWQRANGRPISARPRRTQAAAPR
jgi:glutamate formiminotransferase